VPTLSSPRSTVCTVGVYVAEVRNCSFCTALCIPQIEQQLFSFISCNYTHKTYANCVSLFIFLLPGIGSFLELVEAASRLQPPLFFVIHIFNFLFLSNLAHFAKCSQFTWVVILQNGRCLTLVAILQDVRPRIYSMVSTMPYGGTTLES